MYMHKDDISVVPSKGNDVKLDEVLNQDQHEEYLSVIEVVIQ